MSMFGASCPNCWDNPCTCGKHYNYVPSSLNDRESIIKELNEIKKNFKK